MKRLPLAAAVTSLLLTSCAGGGGEPGLPASTAPNETTTTRPPPPVPATDLPEPRPSLLAAIVLFPGELPEPYTDLPFDTIESGYRPAG
ncbi:MAG TPA: hypothetical protein VLL51_04460, partial [Gemmatimonadales bacterium]|nr:hypothetical protein [Gemmatimonadales bacterium]